MRYASRSKRLKLAKYFPMILLVTISNYGKQVSNEWIRIFNGTDLSGWKVLNGSAEYTALYIKQLRVFKRVENSLPEKRQLLLLFQ